MSAGALCKPARVREARKCWGGLQVRTWSYKEDLMPGEGGRRGSPEHGEEPQMAKMGLDGIV